MASTLLSMASNLLAMGDGLQMFGFLRLKATRHLDGDECHLTRKQHGLRGHAPKDLGCRTWSGGPHHEQKWR